MLIFLQTLKNHLGSDGLKYTQSMGYLQEKIAVHTQTREDWESRTSSVARSARTAPAGPNLPPLTRKQRSYQRIPQTPGGLRSRNINILYTSLLCISTNGEMGLGTSGNG